MEKTTTTTPTPTTTKTTTVIPSTTTTQRFRHVEETTKPNNIHRRNRVNENDLRIGMGPKYFNFRKGLSFFCVPGFSGWTGIKCSSEFCREPK